MTEEGIVGKLRVALSDDVDTECKVLYILAEARKLLDTYPPDPIPLALKIYCHWALHVDLTHPGTTFSFLKRVDDCVASVLEGGKNINLELVMLEEFVLMRTFKEQLKTFLRAYNLPTAICDDNNHWNRFLQSYAGIIEDGSLSCVNKGNGLKHVKEVTFSKGRPANKDSYLPFYLAWSIALSNGKTMNIEVQAGRWDDGSEGISNSIYLR